MKGNTIPTTLSVWRKGKISKGRDNRSSYRELEVTIDGLDKAGKGKGRRAAGGSSE